MKDLQPNTININININVTLLKLYLCNIIIIKIINVTLL
jgi:hypothetical protein